MAKSCRVGVLVKNGWKHIFSVESKTGQTMFYYLGGRGY